MTAVLRLRRGEAASAATGAPASAPVGRTVDAAGLSDGAHRTSFRQSLLAVESVFLVVVGSLAVLVLDASTWQKAAMVLAVTSLPFAQVAVVNPVVRRVALRSVRHGSAVAPAVFATAMSTALVTSALLLGNGVRRAAAEDALERLGPVDVVLEARDADAAAAARAAIERAASATTTDGSRLTELVDALPLPVELVRTVVSSGVAGRSDVNVLGVDVGAAAGFGGNPSETGLTAPGPGEGHALITAPLAARLRVAGAGAVVELATGKERVPFIVDRIVPARGLAALEFPTAASGGAAVIVAPGAASRLATASGGALAVRRLLLLSASGSAGDGARRSGPLLAALGQALESVPAAPRDATGGVAVVSAPVIVRPVKQALVRDGRRVARRVVTLYAGIAGAAAAAALALAVTAVTLRMRERAAQHEALRGLGLRRIDSAAALAMESFLLALPGVVAGALLGVALAAGGARAAGRIAGRRLAGGFAADQALLGAAIGLAVAAALGAWAAWNAGDADHTDAVGPVSQAGSRGTHAGREVVRRVTLRTIAFTVLPVLAAIAVGALVGRGALWTVVVAVLLVVWLNRRLLAPRAHVLRAVSAGLGCIGLLGLPTWLADRAAAAHTATYVLLSLATVAVALAFATEVLGALVPVVARLAARLVGRRRPHLAIAARVGAGYSNADRTVSSLLVSTVALVVCALMAAATAHSLLGAQQAAQERDGRGGFDVVVQLAPTAAVGDDQLRAAGASSSVRLRGATAEVSAAAGVERFRPVEVRDLPRALLDGGPPALVAVRAGVPSMRQAYELVRQRPGTAIVAADVLVDDDRPGAPRLAPGAQLYLRDVSSGRSLTVDVVGVQNPGAAAVAGVWVSTETLTALFGTQSPVATVLTTARADAGSRGHRAAALASRLDALAVPGLDARPFEDLVAAEHASLGHLMVLLQVFLLSGLATGAIGVAAVMAHSARARADDLRVLRALGFDASMVRTVWLVEAAAVGVLATVVGIVTGTLVPWRAASLGVLGHGVPLSAPLPVAVALAVGVPLLCVVVARRAAAAAAALVPR